MHCHMVITFLDRSGVGGATSVSQLVSVFWGFFESLYNWDMHMRRRYYVSSPGGLKLYVLLHFNGYKTGNMICYFYSSVPLKNCDTRKNYTRTNYIKIQSFGLIVAALQMTLYMHKLGPEF